MTDKWQFNKGSSISFAGEGVVFGMPATKMYISSEQPETQDAEGFEKLEWTEVG